MLKNISISNFGGRGAKSIEKSQAKKWSKNQSTDGSQMQLESIRSEARTRATAGKLDQAVVMYDKALLLDPEDTQCLVARAKCHLHLGNYDKAVIDAEIASTKHPKLPKASYIKAEALYQKGEFEMALVFYHRARRLRPGAPQYDRGIKKAEAAIDNAVGESAGRRLDKSGDLSFFDKQKAPNNRSLSVLARRTSDQHQRAHIQEAETKRTHNKTRNVKTVKQLLGSLFGDWAYLDNLLKDEERLLGALDEEARDEELKRKRLIKERREMLKGNNPSRQVEDDDDKVVPPNRLGQDVRRMKRGFSNHIRDLSQNELIYLSERTDFWLQQKSPTGTSKSAGAARGSCKARRPVISASHVIAKLQDIEKDQRDGRLEQSTEDALTLLRQLESVSDSTVPNRPALVASLHCVIGNAHIKKGDLRSALRHHSLDLSICQQSDLVEGRSRALDNVARVHAKLGDFHSAIHVFLKKLPHVREELERTWLHHELGRCYLEVQQYGQAKMHAEQALKAARNTGDAAWLLNTQVLRAQALLETGDLIGSLDAFEASLDTARVDADSEAQQAIQVAIDNVKGKIVQQEIHYGDDNGKSADDHQNPWDMSDDETLQNSPTETQLCRTLSDGEGESDSDRTASQDDRRASEDDRRASEDDRRVSENDRRDGKTTITEAGIRRPTHQEELLLGVSAEGNRCNDDEGNGTGEEAIVEEPSPPQYVNAISKVENSASSLQREVESSPEEDVLPNYSGESFENEDPMEERNF